MDVLNLLLTGSMAVFSSFYVFLVKNCLLNSFLQLKWQKRWLKTCIKKQWSWSKFTLKIVINLQKLPSSCIFLWIQIRSPAFRTVPDLGHMDGPLAEGGREGIIPEDRGRIAGIKHLRVPNDHLQEGQHLQSVKTVWFRFLCPERVANSQIAIQCCSKNCLRDFLQIYKKKFLSMGRKKNFKKNSTNILNFLFKSCLPGSLTVRCRIFLLRYRFMVNSHLRQWEVIPFPMFLWNSQLKIGLQWGTRPELVGRVENAAVNLLESLLLRRRIRQGSQQVHAGDWLELRLWLVIGWRWCPGCCWLVHGKYPSTVDWRSHGRHMCRERWPNLAEHDFPGKENIFF